MGYKFYCFSLWVFYYFVLVESMDVIGIINENVVFVYKSIN